MFIPFILVRYVYLVLGFLFHRSNIAVLNPIDVRVISLVLI